MAFTNSAICFVEVLALVDAPVPVDVPITGKFVAGGSVGEKAVAKVEGTSVETVGITV